MEKFHYIPIFLQYILFFAHTKINYYIGLFIFLKTAQALLTGGAAILYFHSILKNKLLLL